MARKKTDPYKQQAESLALTRYGPEISALKALMLQAQENRDTALRQAKTGRQFTVGAVDQARPQIINNYTTASNAIQPAFAQQGGLEAAALGARSGEAQALALSQLQARRVGAIEGEAAARTQAIRDFRSDAGKVATRASDLARESGAFTASTISDLIGSDAKATADANDAATQRAQSERNALIGAGIDPDTGKILPGHEPRSGSGSGSKNQWASQEQHAAAADAIAEVRGWAQKLKGQGVDRRDAASALATGAEPHPIYKTVEIKKNGKVVGTKQVRVLNPDGTQAMTPSLPKSKSQLLLVAALDMAYDGHLSRKTQKLLHARKLQIGQLGDLVTFQEWLKTPAGQEWRRRQRFPQNGSSPSGNPSEHAPGYHGSI